MWHQSARFLKKKYAQKDYKKFHKIEISLIEEITRI